jgi:N-acylneuraminate cytidylyltransferase
VVWGLNGAIYVWQRAALARAAEQGFWSVRMVPSVMPRHRSVDIDDTLDFEMAEWLFQRQQQRQ